MSTYEESCRHLANLKAVFTDFAELSDQFDEDMACCVRPMLLHAYWTELDRGARGLYARGLCGARLAASLFNSLPESYGGKCSNFPKTRGELWSIMTPAFALGTPTEAEEFEELIFCSQRRSEEERKKLRECIEKTLSSYAERNPSATRNTIMALQRRGANMDDDVVHALTKLVSRFGSADAKRALFGRAT